MKLRTHSSYIVELSQPMSTDGCGRYWCKVIIALTGGQETGSFSCDSI